MWWNPFKLWGWRRLLGAPWTAGRSNQLILKEINPEYSLEGLMLNLQYFGHLLWRTNSLEKTLMLERLKAGGEGDDRGWDVALPTQWKWVWASFGREWRTEKPGVLWPIGLQRIRHNLATEQQKMWWRVHKNANRGRFRELPGWWTHPCTERLRLNSPRIELPTLRDLWTWPCVSLHLAGCLHPWSYLYYKLNS